MQEQERDELLYRLDERTDRIEQEHMRRLKEIEGDVAKNYGLIENLDNRVQANETKVNIAAGSLGAVGTAALAWIGKFLGLIKGL